MTLDFFDIVLDCLQVVVASHDFGWFRVIFAGSNPLGGTTRGLPVVDVISIPAVGSLVGSGTRNCISAETRPHALSFDLWQAEGCFIGCLR